MAIGDHGWFLSRSAKEHPLVYRALMYTGRVHLALPNCIGGRVGRGIQTLAGIHGPTDAMLCWFLENNLSQHFHIYTSPKQHVDLFNLFGDNWESVIWFQCLSVEEQQLDAIRILAPDEA